MWFIAKIKYSVQDRLGRQKTLRESFLFDGITYGEIEKILAERLEGRVTDYDYDVVKASFNAVYDTFVGGDFYKVMIEESSVDGKGNPKVTTYAHLVAAHSVPDAESRAAIFTKNWLNSTTIVGADKTKILGVWHPHNEGWKTDFISRMRDLAEEGNQSADANQTSIFDREGNPKSYDGNEGEPSIDNSLRNAMATVGASEVTVTGTGPNGESISHTLTADRYTTERNQLADEVGVSTDETDDDDPIDTLSDAFGPSDVAEAPVAKSKAKKSIKFYDKQTGDFTE